MAPVEPSENSDTRVAIPSAKQHFGVGGGVAPWGRGCARDGGFLQRKAQSACCDRTRKPMSLIRKDKSQYRTPNPADPGATKAVVFLLCSISYRTSWSR